jgi:hypothetical protein
MALFSFSQLRTVPLSWSGCPSTNARYTFSVSAQFSCKSCFTSSVFGKQHDARHFPVEPVHDEDLSPVAEASFTYCETALVEGLVFSLSVPIESSPAGFSMAIR